MGYYTYYNLTARKVMTKEQFEKIEQELKDREIIGYALDDGRYNEKQHEAVFYSYDECKWYDHAEHMVKIAEKFPDVYFELDGEGEERGDYWKEYYHDMDIETCRGEIVYEQPKKIQWTELIPF